MPSSAPVPLTITVGADPELFVYDKKTKKIVSAHDLLPGTKEEPFKVDYGAIQVDGTAAEFNIEPAADQDTFERNITQVQRAMQARLGSRYELRYLPSHTYSDEYFKSLPENTKILGCNPDWNAYTMSQTPTPDRGDTPTLCTASGHIHVGWNNTDNPFDVNDFSFIEDCAIVARQLDFAIGIQSLLWDPDPVRRKLYGKAGCFRPKPYGMEYRSLSNVWLDPGLPTDTTRYAGSRRKDADLVRWIFQQVYYAVSRLMQGADYSVGSGWKPETARDIIDGNVTDWIYRPEYKRLVQSSTLPARLKFPDRPGEEKKSDPDFYKTKKGKSKTMSVLQDMIAQQSALNSSLFPELYGSSPGLSVLDEPTSGEPSTEITLSSSDFGGDYLNSLED